MCDRGRICGRMSGYGKGGGDGNRPLSKNLINCILDSVRVQ